MSSAPSLQVLSAKFAPWLSRIIALMLMVLLIGLMPEIAGIDPAQSIVKARGGQQQLLTAEALAAIEQELHLSQPADERLWAWLTQVLQGDFGRSWIDNAPVLPSITSAAHASLLLMSSSLLLTLLLSALSLGFTLRQWQQGRLTAQHNLKKLNLNTYASTLLVSIPEYVIATLCILVFAIWLTWLPPYGWLGMAHLVLPSFALAIPAAGLFSRLVNDSLKRVLQEPWVITWLSGNVHLTQIIRFALRRALTNLIPQIAMIIIGLTGGAVAVEQIFSIPGIGRLVLGAAKAQDLPLLQGCLLIMLLFAMLLSSLALGLQQYLLGNHASSGKLIASHSRLQLTQNRYKLALSALLFSLLIATAIYGQVIDPYLLQFPRLAAPSWQAPFGADALGRDILARVGAGMLTTLKLGALATLCSLVLGVILGMFSRAAQGFIEVAKGVPYIIAGLLVAGLSGMSPHSAFIAIVLVAWAPLAAHCASLVLEARAQPYVTLSPVWGNQSWRIFRYYLAPYILPPLLRHTLLRFPAITLSLTSLSFIGLGAKPPAAEWGLLIAENLPYLERAPQAVLLPIAGLLMITLAINLLIDDAN